MKCILFSGGWDSVAVALMDKDADLVFFKYNQIYFDRELQVVQHFANTFSRNVRILELPYLTHDAERRNMHFLTAAKVAGYKTILTGNRNVLPIFDKYKDSNWLSLKLFGWLMNLEIKMPIVGWGKRRIVKFVMERYEGRPYNCYKNGDNYRTCDCVNCLELQKILI